jgi:polyphosphate kinase 2 (PPK2 family)
MFQDIHSAEIERITRDLEDRYDEEYELEPGDRLEHSDSTGEKNFLEIIDIREERRKYFRELFRLQHELAKLQDWVVATGHRLVIVFEGRDAAGKGCIIKRITQRLNPRACRVAALPAPNNREKTQWHFQP